jgi:hypothetical protein
LIALCHLYDLSEDLQSKMVARDEKIVFSDQILPEVYGTTLNHQSKVPDFLIDIICINI